MTKHLRMVGATIAVALAAVACGDGETVQAPKANGPAVTIEAPANGATLKGNVATIELGVRGIDIVRADGKTDNATGHYHLFIDRPPVAAGETIPREPGIVHSADFRVVLAGLSVGKHTVTAVLGNGAHQRIGTAQAETTFTIGGPTIDVTAPATVEAGKTFTLKAVVDGVRIVKADGDTSGATGHLHIFIDRDPVPAGEIIGKDAGIIHSADLETVIGPLEKGDHTIWVLVGDGTHRALKPLVADRLVVTVA